MWQDILKQIVEALGIFILSVIGILSTWALETLRKKLNSDLTSSILQRIDNTAQHVVNELEQTVVAEIIDENGKLPLDQVKYIKGLAVDRLLDHISESDKSVIQKSGKDLNKTVNMMIESAVLRGKIVSSGQRG